jgi:hypothetical protein
VFVTEVLEGGDLDTIDDVLAPDYVNTAMGNTDLAGFSTMVIYVRRQCRCRPAAGPRDGW